MYILYILRILYMRCKRCCDATPCTKQGIYSERLGTYLLKRVHLDGNNPIAVLDLLDAARVGR